MARSQWCGPTCAELPCPHTARLSVATPSAWQTQDKSPAMLRQNLRLSPRIFARVRRRPPPPASRCLRCAGPRACFLFLLGRLLSGFVLLILLLLLVVLVGSACWDVTLVRMAFRIRRWGPRLRTIAFRIHLCLLLRLAPCPAQGVVLPCEAVSIPPLVLIQCCVRRGRNHGPAEWTFHPPWRLFFSLFFSLLFSLFFSLFFSFPLSLWKPLRPPSTSCCARAFCSGSTRSGRAASFDAVTPSRTSRPSGTSSPRRTLCLGEAQLLVRMPTSTVIDFFGRRIHFLPAWGILWARGLLYLNRFFRGTWRSASWSFSRRWCAPHGGVEDATCADVQRIVTYK